MKIAYQTKNFKPDSLELINQANKIISEYQYKGYELTLRQVYYQLVARGVIPNNERSYKNLGNLISDARMTGLIDWLAIIDRTRNLQHNAHWTTPADIIDAAARQFAFDKWEDQDTYLEVWVEKDALIGIVGQSCRKLDVPHFSCRGYVSQSEMWSAAQRMKNASRGKDIVIIHLGDHDPSGKDMSRDIVDRMRVFGIDSLEFKRIALNMDQIEQYNPPPNPTKLTDSRATGYIEQYGHECWELDALKPEIIDDLITRTVSLYCDQERFKKAKERERNTKKILETVSDKWSEIEEIYK
jgi:hypothetical protein